MTAQDKMRLRQIRAKINKGIVIFEDEVQELRELEHKAAVNFAKINGLKLGKLAERRGRNV